MYTAPSANEVFAIRGTFSGELAHDKMEALREIEI
jgi:hypothetical protein